MMTRFVCSAAFVLAALAACGSEVNFNGSSGNGSGSSTGAGAGNTCAAFNDQDGQGTVTLRVRNNTGIDIYLPTNCGVLMPVINPGSGPDGNNYRYDRSCLSTCEDLQHDGPIACTAEACALVALRIAHGGSVDIPWNGTGLHATEMPAQCWFDAGYGTQCSQIVTAPTGSYRVEITAFDSCGPESCTCDANGQCFGEATGLEGYPDPTVFTYPTDDMVEVVFGGCAFGCAEG